MSPELLHDMADFYRDLQDRRVRLNQLQRQLDNNRKYFDKGYGK